MSIRLLAGVAGCALLSVAVVASGKPVPRTAALPRATGYFAHPSTLPFHAPDFTKFKDGDLQPAVEQGIAIKRAEIEAIANNRAAPTFENTLVAMQRAGQVYDRA